MSRFSIPSASQERLPTERVSQTEADGDKIVNYQGVFAAEVGAAPRPEPRYLELSQSKAMAVDGSSTDQLFELTPATDEVLRVKGVRLFMRAGTAIGFTDFGDLTALGAGDGLILELHDGTTALADMFGGDEIRTTEDLIPFADRFELLDSSLVLVADLMFPTPLRLVWAATGLPRLRATVRANLTALTELTMLGLLGNEAVLL